jgi:2-iminoacetate synthase
MTVLAQDVDTRDFIDDEIIHGLIGKKPDPARFSEIIEKSKAKQALTVEETAVLVNADEPWQTETIFETAKQLKREVYGNRIVLFAPLYVGNLCINDCEYCGFRRSNKDAIRRTLSHEELQNEVAALENVGHKRLILVYGESPKYNAEYIADTVRTTYSVKSGNGVIRRVNINAAPLSVEDYRTVKAAGIGTYQIFQETYHKETYARIHPKGTRKADFLWRLHGLGRAMEGGIDDVGLGALFGLYDWRFDLLALVTHALDLQKTYGVGPHTISFPRIRKASKVDFPTEFAVSDEDFERLVAILRLAVPYTGLIMTCRESAETRKKVLAFGVSQIDAGTRLEIGGYSDVPEDDPNALHREQFALGDARPLDLVVRELMEAGYIPSFCTACYRTGRTGEIFMEYAIPGFISSFCTPNALTTLQEFLSDYASSATKTAGERLIASEFQKLPEGDLKQRIGVNLARIRNSNDRDLYE